MSEENRLIGKSYVCVTRQISDPTDKEKVETVDIGLLIDNSEVDWDKFDSSRAAKLTLVSEEDVEVETKQKTWVPFVKKTVKETKKEKVEKTLDTKRHFKAVDLYLSNVQKQDIIDAALATIGTGEEVPLTVEVYHDVGHYDPSDLQHALTVREYQVGYGPDLKLVGWTKSVEDKKITFTGEVVKVGD